MKVTFSLTYIDPLNKHRSQNKINLVDLSRSSPIMPLF